MSYGLGAVSDWIDNDGKFPQIDGNRKIEIQFRGSREMTTTTYFALLTPLDFELNGQVDDIIKYRWVVYF